ncbi:MAG: glycosyltransferase [Pseudomonadota bacterium]
MKLTPLIEAARQNRAQLGQSIEHEGLSLGPMVKAFVGVVLVHHRAPAHLKRSLESLGPQLERANARIVIVDNHSNDGSAEEIARYLSDAYGEGASWKLRVSLIRSATNRGFAGGINYGLSFFDAPFNMIVATGAEVHPGTLNQLLRTAKANPKAGVIGARIAARNSERPSDQGTRQQNQKSDASNAFAFHGLSPMSEFAEAAQIPALSAAKAIGKRATRANWVRFACALIRRKAITAAGPLDEQYYMYFEDADYCRTVRKKGFTVLCDPSATVSVAALSLRNKSPFLMKKPTAFEKTTNKTKQVCSPDNKDLAPLHGAAARAEKSPAEHFQASRERYFRKRLGPFGPLFANIGWQLGRGIFHICELLKHFQLKGLSVERQEMRKGISKSLS